MEFPKEKSPCTSSTTPADTPPVKTDQQPGAAKVDLGPLGLTGRWLSSQAQAKLVETAEPVKPVLQRSKQMEMEMEAGDVDDVRTMVRSFTSGMRWRKLRRGETQRRMMI